MAIEGKHVWILGAGFSYPLGAPLFGQVFRKMASHCVTGTTANHRPDESGRQNAFDDNQTRRKNACKFYRKFAPPEEKDDPWWDNPEEFLQVLSDAVEFGKNYPPHHVLFGEAK